MKVMTKELVALLKKYKKANRARCNAYAARSRTLGGVWDNKLHRRVFKQEITEDLKKQLDANIETARLYKLEVSAEVRAYCKKRKLHIEWGDSNQIDGILTHMEWQLKTYRHKHCGDTLLKTMYLLKLSQARRYCF